jgi:hypothetical protein
LVGPRWGRGSLRHLIGDRLDITGARWGLKGAEAVLKLRALVSNGDFPAYSSDGLGPATNPSSDTDRSNLSLPIMPSSQNAPRRLPAQPPPSL